VNAAELLAVVRAELAPVERRLAEHRYLAELETGRVPVESLRAFAGEQRVIITSDRRSFEHLAQRFPQPPAGGFFRDLAAGEAEALRLLERFAAAVARLRLRAACWLPGLSGLRRLARAQRCAGGRGARLPREPRELGA
jgi:hypothetical protein